MKRTLTDVILHGEPDSEGSSGVRLSADQRVTVVETNGGWALVVSDGGLTGWCESSMLDDVQTTSDGRGDRAGSRVDRAETKPDSAVTRERPSVMGVRFGFLIAVLGLLLPALVIRSCSGETIVDVSVAELAVGAIVPVENLPSGTQVSGSDESRDVRSQIEAGLGQIQGNHIDLRPSIEAQALAAVILVGLGISLVRLGRRPTVKLVLSVLGIVLMVNLAATGTEFGFGSFVILVGLGGVVVWSLTDGLQPATQATILQITALWASFVCLLGMIIEDDAFVSSWDAAVGFSLLILAVEVVGLVLALALASAKRRSRLPPKM